MRTLWCRSPHPAAGCERGRGKRALPTESADTEAPLIALAVGRSGDKGNAANYRHIARRPDYLPWLRQALTVEAVRAFFAAAGVSKVERFGCPHPCAEFRTARCARRGGVCSLRIDPQGKAFAQMLMDYPVGVSRTLADQAALANRQ